VQVDVAQLQRQGFGDPQARPPQDRDQHPVGARVEQTRSSAITSASVSTWAGAGAAEFVEAGGGLSATVIGAGSRVLASKA